MDWSYDRWDSGEPYEWGEAARSEKWDALDFHVDLGCGHVKKGRIGIDRFAAPGVNVVMDLDSLRVYSLAAAPGEDAPPTPHGWIASWESEGRPNHDRLEAKVLGRGLPFANHAIKSIVSHHVLEHIGDGFPRLMDECHRVLEPGGIFRIIVPVFPSYGAIVDPDHRRFFIEGSFEHMLAYPEMGFAVPYLQGRWEVVDMDTSPRTHWSQAWTPEDQREMRVALRAVK